MAHVKVKAGALANTPLRKNLINETISSLLRARSIALSACELLYIKKDHVVLYQNSSLRKKMARVVDRSCMRDPGLALAAKIDKPYGIVAQRTLSDIASIPVNVNSQGFLFFHHNFSGQSPVGLSFLAKPLSIVPTHRLAMNVFGDLTRPYDNFLLHRWLKLSGGDPFAGAATMAALFQLYVTEDITDIEAFDPNGPGTFSAQRIPCSPELLDEMLFAVRTILGNVHEIFARNDDGAVPPVYVDPAIVSAVLEARTRKRLLRILDTKEALEMDREFRGTMSPVGYLPTSVPRCEAYLPPYFTAKDDNERYDTIHTGTFSMTSPHEGAVFSVEEEFRSKTRYEIDILGNSLATAIGSESPTWPKIARNMATALRYIPNEYLIDMPRYTANVEKGCLRIYHFMNATRGIMTMKLLQNYV